jgi:hypothetical protein
VGRVSNCAAAITALFILITCTELQAATRTKDCLPAPNASSPRGQHWYYRIDVSNNHKCWYLHSTITHQSATRSRLAAGPTPVPARSGDAAPRLPHTPLLSSKPKLTSFDSTKSIDRRDPRSALQGSTPPSARTLHLDEPKMTDAAASSPAAAKSIHESDDPSISGAAPQVAATTDMALTLAPEAAPSPTHAKPIQESDAPSPEEAPQVDGFTTTDTGLASRPEVASSPAIQQGALSWIAQEEEPQGNSQVNGSKPPGDRPTSSPPATTFRAVGADAVSTSAVALPDNGIAGALRSNLAQIGLLSFAGLAIFVFVISMLNTHRPAPHSLGFQSGRGSLAGNASSVYIPVDDTRPVNRTVSSPSRIRPESARTNGEVITSKTPRKFAQDVKVALDSKPTLVYRARSRGGPGLP